LQVANNNKMVVTKKNGLTYVEFEFDEKLRNKMKKELEKINCSIPRRLLAC